MISYKPLLKLLVDRDMSVSDLWKTAGISPNTMTKIRRNEEVSMSVLTKICRTLGVSYGDRIEKVEKVIADNIDAIKEKIPAIIEGPFYKGVTELGESSVNLLFVAKCKEEDIYQVQRDLNREIKIVFDDNGISIPFPQVTVSYEKEQQHVRVSKKEKNEAEEFVEEQKEVSKGIEDRK